MFCFTITSVLIWISLWNLEIGLVSICFIDPYDKKEKICINLSFFYEIIVLAWITRATRDYRNSWTKLIWPVSFTILWWETTVFLHLFVKELVRKWNILLLFCAVCHDCMKAEFVASQKFENALNKNAIGILTSLISNYILIADPMY